MYTLRYLEQSKHDLMAIKQYIAKESGSTTTALKFTDKLREQCRKLAEIGGTIGTPRPELSPDIRSFPYGNYVIFFRYSGSDLQVVTIIEGHRDIASLVH